MRRRLPCAWELLARCGSPGRVVLGVHRDRRSGARRTRDTTGRAKLGLRPPEARSASGKRSPHDAERHGQRLADVDVRPLSSAQQRSAARGGAADRRLLCDGQTGLRQQTVATVHTCPDGQEAPSTKQVWWQTPPVRAGGSPSVTARATRRPSQSSNKPRCTGVLRTACAAARWALSGPLRALSPSMCSAGVGWSP